MKRFGSYLKRIESVAARAAGASAAPRAAPSDPEHDAPPAAPKRLGEELIDRGLVTKSQVAEALLTQKASGQRLGETLVDLGFLHERDLATVLSDKLGYPVVDLRERAPDDDAVARLSEEVARAEVAIPIRVKPDAIEIAVADPSAAATIEALKADVGTAVSVVIASRSDILRAIDNAYRAITDVDQHVEAFQISVAPASEDGEVEQRVELPDDAPVVRVVELILTQAHRDRASDVHIQPTGEDIRVRFRIDGALKDISRLPKDMGPAVVSRLKIMAGLNIVERRRPQDGQFSCEVEGKALDVRVATTSTVAGEKAVLRLLDRSKDILRLDDLGMTGDEGSRSIRRDYEALIHSPFGMLIVAGPTGSGKTTTLYASLSEIDEPERNITTIEDPVEYVFPTINQIQINEQAGVTFATGLRSILRQDPDVILVGEIRDVETARIAVQSSLTGHFVLSSVHATDAATAVQRLLDMGIEPFLVASSVLGVVSQRLVRRVCPHCVAPYAPNPEELAFYRAHAGEPTGEERFAMGKGCNFCARTGYQERIGVFEMLRLDDEIKRLIVRRAPHAEIRDAAVRAGMRTMQDEAMRLVAEGVTTLAEVMRAIYVL